MTKVVYGIMSEKELKKRLKDLGLSTSGERKYLIQKHREFVTRYNAAIDGGSPPDIKRIVQSIEREESNKQVCFSSTGYQYYLPLVREGNG